MLKLTLFLSYIVPLSYSLLLCPDSVIAQETVNPNYQVPEIADVSQNTIYVNPHQGNDQAVGDRNSPLKTITQALRNAPDNTVISLSSGTYSEDTGETFPLIIKRNIILQGTAQAQGSNIIIKGGADFISPTGAGQNVAIAIIKDRPTISGITVTNPHTRGHGIWIESANPTITDSSFIGNGNTGVSANGNSQPILTNNYFFNNLGNGLLVYGTSHPKVSNNLFERTGFGVSIVKNGAVTLEANQFQGNRIGVIFEGNSQGILRDNKIFSSLDSGLVAIANSRVDLGTNERSGGNVFRGNGKLDIQNITKNSIVAVGTEVQGKTSGIIDFKGTTNSLVAINSTISSSENSNDNSLSRLREIPLNSLPELAANTVAQRRNTANSAITSGETLPPPPSLTSPNNFASNDEANNNTSNNDLFNTANNQSKELVFSAPTSDLTANNNFNTAATIRYRVLVEASNSSQQAKVRSLYPDAFRTVYQGKSMLQVGAFSQRGKAETASRSLANLGLNSHILE